MYDDSIASILPMKTHPSFPTILTRSLWLSASVGCVLALTPITTRAQSDDAAKDKAAESQPTDPVESKTGHLNQAKAGGAAKISAKDAEFVEAFGSGNAGEIRFAELALKNAESEDVKKFAQMMITDHSKANDQLAQVAKNHNIDFPPAPPAEAVEMSKTLLDVKGAEFDKKYIGAMLTDHTNDVAEYKKAKSEVKDHLLKEYVDSTEPVVAEHLKACKAIEAKLK